jgi:hypothetical protein
MFTSAVFFKLFNVNHRYNSISKDDSITNFLNHKIYLKEVSKHIAKLKRPPVFVKETKPLPT